MQRVRADGERFGIRDDLALAIDEGHVVRHELEVTVLEHLQHRRGLAGVGLRRDRIGAAAGIDAGGVHQRVAKLHEAPAKDRFDDIGVQDMGR